MHKTPWWWKPRQPRPFVVTEPDLVFELLIVALDAPAQLGDVDEIVESEIVSWQRREPVLGRRDLALSAIRSAAILPVEVSAPIIVAMRGPHAHRGKPGAHRALRPRPPRHAPATASAPGASAARASATGGFVARRCSRFCGQPRPRYGPGPSGSRSGRPHARLAGDARDSTRGAAPSARRETPVTTP